MYFDACGDRARSASYERQQFEPSRRSFTRRAKRAKNASLRSRTEARVTKAFILRYVITVWCAYDRGKQTEEERVPERQKVCFCMRSRWVLKTRLKTLLIPWFRTAKR
jgi:hypothetical protein